MENKNNDKKVINCKFSQIFLEFVALLLLWNDSNSVFLRQLKRNNLKQIRNMKKIRAAVVGYGNIGKFTLEALEAAPDFEVRSCFISRKDKDDRSRGICILFSTLALPLLGYAI